MGTLQNRFDLAIIGGGPGGIAAALAAATRGLKVVLADAGDFLGYGLNGAYKSKALWQSANDWLSAERLGWLCMPESRRTLFDKIQQRVHEGFDYLTHMYLRYLELKQVRFVRGFAEFTDPHGFRVGEDGYCADHVIIATGSSPRLLPNVEVDGRRIMTSDHVVNVNEDFRSLLIVGAGVLGCEFASIFSALGIEVTLLDRAERLLSSEDEDISGLLSDIYRRNGVDVRPRAGVRSLRVVDDRVHAELNDGTEMVTDRALLSVGRVPCCAGLNLAAAGVAMEPSGVIRVNDNLQTNVPHIYAVGDVGQRNTPLDLSLVQVAEAEGRMAVRHIVGSIIDIHAEYIPFIIFTMPMIAGAGLNEMQVRERHPDARVATFRNIRNHRYHAMLSHEGFLKLMVGPTGDDRILGVRAIGSQADTVTGEASVLIDNQVPYTYLLEATHAHPSLGESLQNAARVIAGIIPEDF